LREKRHPLFRAIWWTSNGLLAVALASMVYSGIWEYSVRQYLKGFSDAIVPETATAQAKAEDILSWMRNGPPRSRAANPNELSLRDPQNTLNYQQLLAVCGTATNAFLNLARSSGLETRRLLLLTPDRHINHVVAEVLVDDRWIVVDASYRVMLQDAHGRYLTRKDLQDPVIFREATGAIPNYLPEYSYERFAHLHLARIPLEGARIRRMLDSVYSGWDETLDWSLLLERESFFYFFTSSVAVISFLVLRIFLAWLADHRLRVPRFHFREHLLRASAAFFSTPEIK
jgi:hypothetical protein